MPKQHIEAANVDALVREQLAAGKAVMLAEYRGGACEFIRWRDKTTRAAMSGWAVRHYCETAGDKQFAFEERTGEDFDPDAFQPRFPKGTKILVIVSFMSVLKGMVTVGGEMLPLSAETPAA